MLGRVCLFFCLSTGRNVIQQVSSAMYVAPDFRPFLNCKMTPLERSAVGRVLSPNPRCCSRYRQPTRKRGRPIRFQLGPGFPAASGVSVIGRRVTVRGRGQWEAPGLGFTGGSRSLRRASDRPFSRGHSEPWLEVFVIHFKALRKSPEATKLSSALMSCMHVIHRSLAHCVH